MDLIKVDGVKVDGVRLDEVEIGTKRKLPGHWLYVPSRYKKWRYNKMNTVQFVDLDDLIKECESEGQKQVEIVRLEALTFITNVSENKKVIKYGVIVRGVTVRSEVLAWWLRISENEFDHSSVDGMRAGHFDEWEKLSEVADSIKDYLRLKLADGIHIRRGIVDVGSVDLISGMWPLDVWLDCVCGDDDLAVTLDEMEKNGKKKGGKVEIIC